MVLEDKFDLGAAQAADAGIFCHAHVDVGHGGVGNFSGQFGTGTKLAAGRSGTTAQGVDDAYFNCLFSESTRRDNEPDDQCHTQDKESAL